MPPCVFHIVGMVSASPDRHAAKNPSTVVEKAWDVTWKWEALAINLSCLTASEHASIATKQHGTPAVIAATWHAGIWGRSLGWETCRSPAKCWRELGMLQELTYSRQPASLYNVPWEKLHSLPRVSPAWWPHSRAYKAAVCSWDWRCARSTGIDAFALYQAVFFAHWASRRRSASSSDFLNFKYIMKPVSWVFKRQKDTLIKL